MRDSALQKLKRFDANRPSVPGEHWLTLAGAVAVWLASRRHPSVVVRLLGSVAGSALVARAVSGTEVPGKLKEWLPFEKAPRQAGQG